VPLPPTTTPGYDTADTALNFARASANDVGQTIAGSPLQLGDTAPGTFAFLNLGWRRLQMVMTNNGIGTFVKTQVLPSILVAGTTDPGLYCYLNFYGFFDGVNFFTPQTTPFSTIIPSDMVGPLRLWERPSGQQKPFEPMFRSHDGLPQVGKSLYLRVWNWENDQLNLIGATQQLDLQLRYNSWLADIVPDQQGLGSNPIPLLRAGPALGAYTAAAYALSRGSAAAETLDNMGTELVKQMMTTETRARQRGSHRKQPYSRRASTGGWGQY
jgi:hypothetical protein